LYANVGKAACEAWSVMNLATNLAFSLELSKTIENLDQVGWSQDLLEANFFLASSSALNT
jgi:hypothetical protein